MAPVNKPNPYKPGSAAFGAEAARRKSKVGTKDVFADVGSSKSKKGNLTYEQKVALDKAKVKRELKD